MCIRYACLLLDRQNFHFQKSNVFSLYRQDSYIVIDEHLFLILMLLNSVHFLLTDSFFEIFALHTTSHFI